jgi:hypothetical protein
MKTLRATPVVLRALVHGVDDATLRRRPAAGEWAIIEVVGHLADTEERALGRIRRMLAEDNPVLEPFDQEALAIQRRYLDLDLQGELARLEQLRRQHLALLGDSTGRAGNAPGGTGSTAGCRWSCTRPTSPPRRSTTSPRSPGCCRRCREASTVDRWAQACHLRRVAIKLR